MCIISKFGMILCEYWEFLLLVVANETLVGHFTLLSKYDDKFILNVGPHKKTILSRYVFFH